MPGQASRHMFHYLRPAKFTRPVAWSNVERRRRQEQAAKYRTPIAGTMPQLSEAIDTVIELIIRDYVAGWMRAITPEVVLQQRIEELLRIVLIRLKTRVMDLDLTQLLVTRLVPKVTAHVNDFRKAETALRGNSLERSLTESDELDIMVASKYRGGKLHKALSTSVSTKATEEAYLRTVVQAILPTLLPKSEVQSDILRHLLRELLVGAVLRPVMELLSDPDYWNQNVDLYTGKAIREQNMVKKLREALKQHTDNMSADSRMIENPTDPYRNGADLYSFEDFLKMIKRCDSLLDVKRIRNTIMTQMRKKKSLIMNREKDDIVNGHKVEDIIVYINRLDIARRRAEKRIEALGGPVYPKRRSREYTQEAKNSSSLIPLDTILSNPSGLSYFMEFQDRRDNMNELQLWLLIDTLNVSAENGPKTDYEPVGSLVSDEQLLRANRTTTSTPSSTQSKSRASRALEVLTPTTTYALGTASGASNPSNSIRSSRKNSIATTIDITDTLREDVRMIYDTYFAESAPKPVVINHSLVDVFRDFALVDSSNNSNKSVSVFDIDAKKQEASKAAHVRQHLVLAQTQVFEQMLAKDYPEFVKSDLYFKFLTSYQSSLVEQKEEQEDRQRMKPSKSQRSSPTPALFSAIGLASPEKKRDLSENPKRTSTGSFLDIFGLGRDKDKERDRDHNTRSPLKRVETTFGQLRPGFLTPIGSRSKTGSPASMRTTDSGESLGHSSQQQPELKPKQSLDIQSTSELVPATLSRSRSLSSISNPEMRVGTGAEVSSNSAHQRYISAAGYIRDNSLDLDTEQLSKSTSEEGNSRLRDSLLMELQEHEDDDDDGMMGETQEGLTMPRMHKKNGKGNVIDAVEAALSSIMETQDVQNEDLSNSGIKEMGADSPLMDATDPSFSTARDEQPGEAALLQWGQSQKGKTVRKRFKEKTLESGKTVRVKIPNSSSGDRVSLDNIFESEPSTPVETSRTDKPKVGTTDRMMFSDDEGEEKSATKAMNRVRRDSTSDDSDKGAKDKEKRRSTRSPDATESISDAVQDNVHLAAPGDLLLATRIQRLEQDIETVRKQEAIVETLIQKAERQGRENELRILKKSKSALRREILSMEYQKTQYEVQEEENMIMPGRSTINITSSTVGHDGPKEFALYVIEVHQMAQDGSFASGWVIARRYSEFFALHRQLKEKFPAIVRQYELPSKRGFLKLQKSFVEGRRIGLERYLQCLVQHIEICQSQELRAFLSQENVALPQFSAAATTPIIPYSLFDSDSNTKDGTNQPGSTTPTLPSNQHFFEQLFHSATSPLHSPVASRDPSRSLLLSNPGSAMIDGIGANQGMLGETELDEDEGFMKHIYQTVSEGLDDMFSGGPPTVLGNITKQLGNQMMQFSKDSDDEDTDPSLTYGGSRRRHGSRDENGSARMVQSDIFDKATLASQYRQQDPSLSGQQPQRPPLQRAQSSRSRRLSSPDPHTQHQRMQFQRQQKEQQQGMPRQQTHQDKQLQKQQQRMLLSQQQQQEQVQQLPQHQQQPGRPEVVEPEGVTIFTEPLCDLFIELFELKEKNNWLRRQAVVIILQQVLGGTIERKLRDTIKAYIEENMLTFYVFKLRDALWPLEATSTKSSPNLSGGYEIVGEDLGTSPASNTPPLASQPAAKTARTPEQKAMTKDQANRKLSAFLPELLGNMVGHQNARRGARRVFAAFQNRRLNQQLVYTTLDEVIAAMWPELTLTMTSSSSTSAPSMSVPQHGSSLGGTTSTTTTNASLSMTMGGGMEGHGIPSSKVSSTTAATKNSSNSHY
ncbi:Intermediate filament protein [Haplosporangium sp. Z 767]|nr:Intermediate filament protein [Haplosporangium sp. Z 767]